jgi:hypothetical protein
MPDTCTCICNRNPNNNPSAAAQLVKLRVIKETLLDQGSTIQPSQQGSPLASLLHAQAPGCPRQSLSCNYSWTASAVMMPTALPAGSAPQPWHLGHMYFHLGPHTPSNPPAPLGFHFPLAAIPPASISATAPVSAALSQGQHGPPAPLALIHVHDPYTACSGLQQSMMPPGRHPPPVPPPPLPPTPPPTPTVTINAPVGASPLHPPHHLIQAHTPRQESQCCHTNLPRQWRQ